MIIENSYQLDILRKRREDSNTKKYTITKTRKLKKIGMLSAGIISLIGISICSLTLLHTIKRINYKEKLLLEADMYEKYKRNYNTILNELRSIYNVNSKISQGILGTRSGSALLLELKEILPTTIQLEKIQIQGKKYLLEGNAKEKIALDSINSLKLQISNSFLVKKETTFLAKAWKRPNSIDNSMNFRLTSDFTNPSTDALLANYEKVGSIGLFKRVILLKKEGLIR